MAGGGSLPCIRVYLFTDLAFLFSGSGVTHASRISGISESKAFRDAIGIYVWGGIREKAGACLCWTRIAHGPRVTAL